MPCSWTGLVGVGTHASIRIPLEGGAAPQIPWPPPESAFQPVVHGGSSVHQFPGMYLEFVAGPQALYCWDVLEHAGKH